MTHRTLDLIYKDIEKHFTENPTHGTNCSCVDAYIREVRAQLPRYPKEHSPTKYGQEMHPKLKAYYSLHHVITAATRSLL